MEEDEIKDSDIWDCVKIFKMLFVYNENKDKVEKWDGWKDDKDKDIAKDFKPVDFSKHDVDSIKLKF